MKPALILAAFVAAASSLMGATTATYTASDSPGNSPDANGNTVNVWTVSTVGGGSFSGNSATNGDNNGGGAGNPAWAIYSAASSLTEAVHTLVGGALTVGQGVSLAFDNGFLSGAGVTGVSLTNAAGQNLFEFFFTAGQSFYQKNDAGGVALTSKPFTDDGFNFNFGLTGATTYTASLGGTSLSGSLISQTDQAVAKVRVFSFGNNGFQTTDTYFNNLAVAPEPGRAGLMLIGLGTMLTRRRRRRVGLPSEGRSFADPRFQRSP